MKKNDGIYKEYKEVFNLGPVTRRKYELFVMYYLKTGNFYDAYKKYFKSKTIKNIRRNARRLFDSPVIQYMLKKKLKELDDKTDKEIIMNRDKILKELTEILEKTKDKQQYNVALKALSQISKLIGANAPEKSEVDHKGITINYVKPEDNKKDKK